MFPDIELFRIQHKCTLSNMYKKYAVLQHIHKLWKKNHYPILHYNGNR